MIHLRMACGCAIEVADDAQTVICPAHNERRVQSVKARAPKFRGFCLGPYASFVNLPAAPVAMPTGASDE